jgi:uncharacterized protein YecT (DUF1311 family)
MRRVRALAAIALALHVATATAQAPAVDYYCDTWGTYYPWVQTCPVPWRVVNEAPSPSRSAVKQPTAAPAITAPSSQLPTLGDGLDDWCKKVKLPSSIAICSDPELRALMIQRDKAFNEVISRLAPDQQKALLADQNNWVKTYSQACGVSENAPPTLPLSPANRDCMATAGRMRIPYLRAYAGGSGTANPASPETETPSLPPNSLAPVVQANPQPMPPAAPPEQPSAGQNGGSVLDGPAPLALLIGTGIVIAVLMLLYKRYKKKVLSKRVLEAVYGAVAQHKRALVRKRFQTLRHDDYGNLLIEPWTKELLYFMGSVLDPAIRQLGSLEYALYETMRPALLLTIAQLIEVQAGASGNFTLGPNLTPTDYEQYCAEQLRSAGWSANTTKITGDQGSDIIAQKGELRLVVQCKLYNHPVGNKAVQEISAARAHEQADCAAVVSNARYTYSAQQLADTNGVLLLHHSDLKNIDDLLSA